MKKVKMMFSLVLALAMVISGITVVPVSAVQAEEASAETEYRIYPTPQSFVYKEDGGALLLPTEVNAVFESGIDEATKNRLSAVLSLKGITMTESATAVDGKVNILVGIAGSQGAAATYAKENLTYEEGLFNHVDAYLLAIESGQVTIVGKDTDAAFYAMASLKMILEQSENGTVRALQMEDYAIGQYRGFIEGYYGIPWSVEDRISLMNFGGDFKMNTYIFAPKDDPYHNTQWRDLYPADKLAEIRQMVAAGTASKCRFVWAIHPFMNSGITLNNYDESLEIVKAKFEQLYEAGVRQFVISADDANSNVNAQVKLLNDMNAWVKAKGDCYNLAFVPMIYCTAAANWGYGISLTNYYNELKAVDKDVEFMWTGESVCYPATQSTFDHFKQISGKEAFMWLNWPVNDVNHARLVMGPAENCILNTGGVTGFKGLVTNPLEQAEASKTSLFAIADYAWNTSAFDCEKSWEDSFQYIDSGASQALHEMCKHLTNPNPGGITAMSESKEIQRYVTAFQSDFAADNDLTSSGNALIGQFETIINATKAFQENGTNENLKDEMKPWVDSLRGISEAAIGYIRTAVELQKGDNRKASVHYIEGAVAYDYSKNCIAPQLNGTIMAESGAKVLIPFVQSMGNALKGRMEEILGSTFGGSTAGGEGAAENVSAIYSGLGGFHEGNISKVIDGDDSTYAWFNSAQTAGAYIGLDLGSVYRVNTVRIRQGTNDTHGDIFANAILEYSTDGEHYTTLETIANTNNIDRDYSADSVIARYVRIRTATASNKWYAIREFSATVSPATYEAYSDVDALKDVQVRIEPSGAFVVLEEGGKEVSLNAGEYFGIQLPKIREITSVAADYTANANLVLEGSLNGKDWKEISPGEQTEDMYAVRIRNKGEGNVSFRLNALSLENTSRDARFISTVEWEEGHDPLYALDNSLTTSYRAKEGSGAGSLTWRLTQKEKIGKVYILAYPGKGSGAKVLIQTDTDAWVEKGTLGDGMNIVNYLEKYEDVKAVKIEWEEEAPEIMEMYTGPARILGVTLNQTSAKLQLDQTVLLTAEVVVDEEEDDTVTWSSDHPEIASVDENGVVTSKSAGVAVITASILSGEYTASCRISVSSRGTAQELAVQEASAGSVEVESGSNAEGAASLAIDGDNNTIWHSLWAGDEMENLWISVDLGEIKDVSQFKYLPRQDESVNGRVTEYEIYVSQDGEEWTKAAIGTWAEDETLKTAELITPLPARYVRLAATASMSDRDGVHFASAAEVDVFGYSYDEKIADKRYAADISLTPTLDGGRYTEESYQAYAAAKAEVENLTDDETVAQDVVDAVVQAYRSALENLKVKVTGITVNPSEAALKVGETLDLNVTVAPEDASDKNVTFVSDYPEIASVSEEGIVEAKSEGTAVITVTGANGITASCTVTVTERVAVTGIKVDGIPKEALEVGQQAVVTAVVEPADAENKRVIWESSDPKVVSVENGTVTAVAAGEAEITVTTEEGGFKESFFVKVNEPVPPVIAVTGIELKGVPQKALKVGEKVTVTATVQPEDATDKNVVWSSSKPEVASAANGVITAVAAGEAEITAAAGDIKKSFVVKVEAPEEQMDLDYTIDGMDYQVISTTDNGGTVAYKGYKGNKKKIVKIPTSVVIKGKPYKVVSVAKKALYKKTKVTKVVIGGKITSIGNMAFANCKNLKTVTIGKNVTKIGASAFSGNKKLRKIIVKSKKLKKVNKKALAKVKNVTIKVPKAKRKAYRKLFKGKGTTSYKIK